MKRVAGHTRTSSKAVVSTDHTEYEILKRERARRNDFVRLERMVTQLQARVDQLEKELTRV